MQKSIEKPESKGVTKLPPVGTILVVTSTKDTDSSESIAKVGFLCRVTEKTRIIEYTGLRPYFSNLDFNFAENEFTLSNGIWDWYCHELEEITLIQEGI